MPTMSMPRRGGRPTCTAHGFQRLSLHKARRCSSWGSWGAWLQESGRCMTASDSDTGLVEGSAAHVCRTWLQCGSTNGCKLHRGACNGESSRCHISSCSNACRRRSLQCLQTKVSALLAHLGCQESANMGAHPQKKNGPAASVGQHGLANQEVHCCSTPSSVSTCSVPACQASRELTLLRDICPAQLNRE